MPAPSGSPGSAHDVRTPLALIGLGGAAGAGRRPAGNCRRKAGGIRTQSEKLRTLIEDLNLTSKLEYGTQPLRKQEFAAGPLFRELVAQFCESPQAETCEVSLQQTAAAEQAKLCVDRALLERLLENLLGNSIRHNAAPVEIEVQTDVAGNRFCLTVADNGTGYPPAVLAALQGTPQNEKTPAHSGTSCGGADRRRAWRQGDVRAECAKRCKGNGVAALR